jgi:hypothetical protein
MMNKRIILCSIVVFSALGCSPSPITPKTSGTTPSPSLLFDAHGFNSAGIHTNGTSYDDQGYDAHGFSKPRLRPYWRFHRNGTLFNDEGITYNGFRFNEESGSYLYNETNERTDPEGYTWEGHSWDGANFDTRLNRRGFQNYYQYTDRLDLCYYGEPSDDSELTLRDPQGLDFLGFNEHGIHYVTGTEYNEEGLNARGQTREGFLCLGEYGRTTHTFTIPENPDDPESMPSDVDADGYNVWGFDHEGNHRNGTQYSEYGFDSRFFNRQGVHAFTGTRWNEQRYGSDGFNENGFNNHGIHRNETQYDDDGYDHSGCDVDGFDRRGFNPETERHRNGTYYNEEGLDIEGLNARGFIPLLRIHHTTGTEYDPQGFDIAGFNRAGYSHLGFRRADFRNRITGEYLDENGFAINGRFRGLNGDLYDTEPTRAWNCRGFRRDGLYASRPPAEYDRFGFNYQEIHSVTGTVLDPDGYNCWGFHHETGQPRP